jgi:hypothetical protein
MKKSLGIVLGVVTLVAAWGAGAHGATNGVAPKAPVTVRANPDNSIVAATRTAASRVGLGPVRAVGFQPDCSPLAGQVVVCRNPSLHKNGARAVTLTGSNWCVVRTDPSLGGAGHGVNVMIKALRKCLGT